VGIKLFGVDVAKVVNKAMGKGLLPVTLTVVTPGTRSSSALAAGTQPTSVSHPCRGLVEDYNERLIDGETIRDGDRKVLILGDSLPSGVVPKGTDRVTVLGKTYVIVHVNADPAAATYSCQVR